MVQANPSDPIPNDPFYYPETNSIQGPTGPVVIGSGLEITPAGQMIAVGGGPAVTYLVGGPGIYVSSNTGTVSLYNTGVLQINSGNGIQISCTAPGTFTVTNTAPAVNAGGTVTQVNTGDGLIGGPITTNGTIALSNTGVGAGTYQNATVTVDAKGRITSASPGTAISTISGTLPINVTPGSNAVISVNEGSPTVAGVLRICDSTALSCGSIAASSTAVKNAYELGAAALPCSVLTTQGDLISATGPGTPVRVPVGVDGSILKSCSACSSTGGLTWDTLSLCNGTVTSVTAGTGLTGGTITDSGTIALDGACVISPTILPSQGSLLTATGPNNPVALGVGSNGQVLSANNLCTTGLEWSTPTPAVPCSAFNLKGEILVGTSPATYTALPVGVNGSVLVACSACASGMDWIPGQSAILTCEITGKGALITGYGADVPGTLAAGPDNYILSANSSCLLGLEWVANPGGTVTGITASVPLSVDNTNPKIPALSIQAASTTQSGAVQLNDSINSTSVVEAATPNAVKASYDLASSASASAATGIANAALAQADATQALSDASTAQSTADQAVLDAAAAQGTADQAVLDAASAQSTADQALLDAEGAQGTADQAVLDAAAAQGDATQALSDASTAQGTANQAVLDAAAAQGTASAALPKSGGTMTGTITFVGGQTIPTSSIQNASTTQPGVVQLNDTTTSTSTTQALTANQGKNLQDQINTLAVTSNITLAGTLNTATGNLATVTTAGTTAGFAVGSPLPSAASGNAEFFVIVTVASASYTPPGGSATVTHVGDWFLSSGSTWQFLDVGFDAPYASTAVAGIVELATNAETQTGTDATLAVTPAGLQSKLSDSTSTTSSTTIASSTAVKSAYDEATGATAAASAAQDTADQALLDAAAAQTTADAAIPCAALTAKGSILGASAAGTPSALAVGTDGQILYACSTATDGLCWAAAPGGSSPATPTVAGVLEGYSCGVDGNISVGFGSMPLVDPASGGCRNTSLGVCALSNLTFGSGNVAIGSQTLFCATNSGNSIAIGNCALRSSTFSGNVAIGNRAACTVTTGDNNVAIGSGAMQNATTPSLSIAIGCRAMQCGAGSGNMGFGLQALCKVSGNNNIGLGYASGSNLTTGSNNTFLGSLTGGFTTTGGCNIFIGFGAGPNSNADCCLWIGLDSATPWLTGNNTSALKPGAGIIDCAGSCGTAGQVLMSTGSNALCWGTVSSGSGTVTSITAGTGLTGGTITTTGTIALDTACVIAPSIYAAKGNIITATAASTPSALAAGTDGQVLSACSACSTGLVWATPQTSPFITYTTSAISYTSGTPVLVAVWNGGFLQGTITLDLVGYGGVTPFWDIFLSGDATNYNTGWYQTAFWPPTTDGLSQGTWYVDFPVYPSANNGKWEFYFNPTQNSLNPSSFTFFFRTNSVPTWQI